MKIKRYPTKTNYIFSNTGKSKRHIQTNFGQEYKIQCTGFPHSFIWTRNLDSEKKRIKNG